MAFTLCMLWGVHTLSHAQGRLSETRGELLYSTHCNACHSEKIYWRDQRLATDWSSLIAQVRRWQASIGLGWNEEEITDVAHYLNATHYGFPVTLEKELSQGAKPDRVLHPY